MWRYMNVHVSMREIEERCMRAIRNQILSELVKMKVMKTEVTDFDVSEYLTDEKSISEYLTAVMEENDTRMLLSAIGDIAKAQGMSRIAAESGLGRESLYKALNANAKPRFDTILKVLEALGVNISFTPRHETEDEEPAKRKPARKKISRKTASPRISKPRRPGARQKAAGQKKK
jgi:probable addiction module antidote protein